MTMIIAKISGIGKGVIKVRVTIGKKEKMYPYCSISRSFNVMSGTVCIPSGLFFTKLTKIEIEIAAAKMIVIKMTKRKPI